MNTVYLVKNFLLTISLSLNSITVLNFDTPIDSYFLGTSQEFIYSTLSKDKKSLILKGLKRGKESNLFVKTKTDQFAFSLYYGESGPKNLQIKRAKGNQTYEFLRKEKDFTLYRGRTSILKVYKDKREELLSKF